MKRFTAVLLWLIVVFSIVAMWNPARWTTAIPEIGVLTLASLLLLACAAGWQKLEVHSILGPLAATVLCGLLQMAIGSSIYTWRTKVAVIYWSANLAMFFTALQVFAEPRIRRRFLDAIVFFACAIAVVGALQSLDPSAKVFGLFTPDPRLIPQFGPFPYRNQYAAFVELLLPWAMFRAITDEKWALPGGLVIAVLYTSVIAAASRMGFFLVTAEMFVVPALVIWQKRIPLRRVRGPALFFAAILAMLATGAGPAVLLQKFEATDPYAGRREFTEASLAMLKDRPLLGFGLGTWSAVYPGYAKTDDGLFVNQAHDDWAQWAAEGGLPFAAVILGIAVWSARRAMRAGWGVGVTAVFVHCLVDYPIQRSGVAFVMFAMLAAVAAEGERARSSHPPPGHGSPGQRPALPLHGQDGGV